MHGKRKVTAAIPSFNTVRLFDVATEEKRLERAPNTERVVRSGNCELPIAD